MPATSRALSHDHVPFVAAYVREEGAERYTERDWLRRHNVDRIERWERDGAEIRARITNDEVRSVVEPLVSGDHYYAEVAAVEPAGVQTVYSLRVDSADHAFLTDGFVSHNTEARLAPIAREMLRDLDADTVDFQPNYDGQNNEPVVLPARFPNLLVNGSSGIAVGMATNIPPHNLRETIAATIAYIDDPDIDTVGLMQHIKGPDFPTGGADPRPERHQGGLRDRPRPHPRARQGAHRGGQAGQGPDRHHRAALHGQEGRRRRPDQEDRRPARREEAHRDHEHRGPLGPPRHARGDRAQARRQPEGRPQQALQAHPAADDVRREHGRAGGQRAADAAAAVGDPQLRPAPARGHRPPLQARAAHARGARAPARGPADRARPPRRGDRADPRLARPRRRPHRPDGAATG